MLEVSLHMNTNSFFVYFLNTLYNSDEVCQLAEIFAGLEWSFC